MKIAVLGSGNGGHAVAFEFAKAGHDIYMYDFEQFPTNIAAIAEKGGIKAEVELEGFQKIAYAGHDLEKCLDGAEVVFVVGTGEATIPFAKACKPYVKPGQTYIICPGSCFGALEFKTTIGYDIEDETVVVAETSTLPYAARIVEPGHVRIPNRLKGGYFIAALPKSATPKVHEFISKVYTNMKPAASIVQTSLQNGNPAIHPAVMLCNLARTENQLPWLFYHEGVTTSVGRIIKAIDVERMALGKMFGVNILSEPDCGMQEGYMYNETYDIGYAKAPGFAGIMAPTTTDHRYFNEDVNGLCLWEDMGKFVGMPTPNITTMINICNIVRDRDYRTTMTKSMALLGLDKYTVEEVKEKI